MLDGGAMERMDFGLKTLIFVQIMWDAALPTAKLQLAQSHWVWRMCGHGVWSPVVIKLGAFCVAVDVVVDRLNVSFFVRMFTTKGSIKVVSGRHTVLILFAQGVE